MKKKTEGGFIALTSVLIIGAVVLVLGISLFHSALTDYSISTAYESGQKAAFLADFCLKEGVFNLKENIDYIGGEEINVNNATCTINFVKQINENTKEISSLGRAGEQPHFSRSSRLVRYVIESSADDWFQIEATSTNLEIVGDFLKLLKPAETVVTRTTASSYWNSSSTAENVEVKDGSLVLAAIELPPEGPTGALSCGDTTESSININYTFSNTSDVRLYRDSTEIAALGAGTGSGTFIDTGLSLGTSYTYTLKDEGIDLDSVICTTSELKENGVFCENDDQCQSSRCYIDDDGDHYAPVAGTKKCQADPQLTGTDCYDANANAKPGQTTCFEVHRGDNSYDYNCVNGEERCVNCLKSDCATYNNCGVKADCYTDIGAWGGCMISISATTTCR